ncbi:acid protease [Rhizoclosmatium globosum]|uniref:Acid protease n=1 Tax=Rhizoclosmatium globosum TaxID=329046 RepID=A0A1Y2CSF7_9FUNG|nr:acid protease [Rhizoclosmatium globosum]|eukprot:ORY49826.1 acid protease [Rhizoclosmatium globosum]
MISVLVAALTATITTLGQVAATTGDGALSNVIAPAIAITAPAKRDGASLNLANFGGGAFFTAISLGTPPQTFNVLVDTGSDWLWVPGVKCMASCSNTSSLFNTSASATFSYLNGSAQQGTLAYGLGSVKGAPARDNLTWGPVTLPNVSFYLVDYEDEPMKRQNTGFGDGILGLAFLGGNVSADHSIVQLMTAKNQLPSGIFSIWLNQSSSFDSDDSVDKHGGRMVFGGADPTLYDGNFTFIPVIRVVSVPDYFWGVSLGPVGVKGMLAGSNMDKFKYNAQGYYSVDCKLAETFPDITFVLGGNPFTLTVTDYVGSDGKTCSMGIGTLAGMDKWIIGDIFLYKYYSVYDVKHKQVGFALASNGTVSGHGLPLTDSILAQGGGSGFGTIPTPSNVANRHSWLFRFC